MTGIEPRYPRDGGSRDPDGNDFWWDEQGETVPLTLAWRAPARIEYDGGWVGIP